MRGKSKRGKTLIGAFTRARDGAVLVVVAVMLFVLAGAVALSIDLGRAWNLDTQLQNAADACALAAATQLDNTVGSRERAIKACADAEKNNRLVKNRQSFATDASGAGLVEFNTSLDLNENKDFVFWYSLGDPDASPPVPPIPATGDEDADYVQVHVRSREVGFFFASAVGAVSKAEPDAYAVAGLTIGYCRLQPLFICNPYDDGSNPQFSMSDPTINPPPEFAGIAIKIDQGGKNANPPGWQEGNFGILAIPDCSGANCVRDWLGREPPLEQCFGAYTETQTGQITSIRQALNTRFDMYDGSFSGERYDPHYLPSRNTVKGLLKTSNMSDCSENTGWVKGANPYDGTWDGVDPATRPEVMGPPRDKCMYTGGCNIPPSVTAVPTPANPWDRFGDGDWAFNHYMSVNHYDVDKDPIDYIDYYNGNGGYCGVDANGDPKSCAGGEIPTRFDVHKWELGVHNGGSTTYAPWNQGDLIPETETGAEGGAICNTETLVPPPTTERRVLEVAVVNCKSPIHDCDKNGENCTEIGGKTKNVKFTKPHSSLRMFLLEPMGVYDTNNDLVAEVIEPGNAVDDLDPLETYIVQLYPVPKQ